MKVAGWEKGREAEVILPPFILVRLLLPINEKH